MKKIAWLFLGLLALPFAAAAADPYKEGVHYVEAPFPVLPETGTKVEVREFFWYGCPHCFHLEPHVDGWLKKLPANAAFIRTPTFDPVHAQAYYALEGLGLLDKLHLAIFKHMHETLRTQEERARFKDPKAVQDFIVSQGVDRKKLLDAWNSFSVRIKLTNAQRLAQDLNVRSVPTLVVDGKYITSPAQTGGEANALKVVDFLIAKAAKERGKKR
jgi:thiol:disulfide interchange protein DsbA